MKQQVYKNVRDAAGRLRQELGDGSRLLIFLLAPGASGGLEVCWPRTDVAALGEPSIALLRACLKRERAVLVHSKADPELRDFAEVDFESALCVPLIDSDRNPVGVIYADHPTRAGAFSQPERLAVERLARGLAGTLGRLNATGGDYVEPDLVEARPLSRSMALGAAVVAVFAAFWLLAPASRPAPPAPPQSGVPQSWVSDPSSVVKSFVRLLELRQFAQAWKLFSPELQAALPLSAFEASSSQWLSDEACRYELARRTVGQANVSGDQASCLLNPDPALEDLEGWRWDLVKLDGYWRINRMAGGPLSAESQ